MAKDKGSIHGKASADDFIAGVVKEFGDGAIIRYGDAPIIPHSVIPTGALPLDIALGGGWPRGRIIEVFGLEGSGKTLLTLHAIANVQKEGGTAAFIDAEHAFSPDWAANVGVDVDKLLIAQPDSGEQALEIADRAGRSGAVQIIVIDSVAALVPEAELRGEMGDQHVGLQARMMSQALRKLTGGMADTGTACIFINQLREKIGVLYGDPKTTTGGKALKFYASIRCEVKSIERLKEGTEVVGNRLRVDVVKNKLAPPFRKAEFNIRFIPPNQGIDWADCLVEVGVTTGVIGKSGSWYTYRDQNIGQGRQAAAEAIRAGTARASLEEDIQHQLATIAIEPAPAGAPPVKGDWPDEGPFVPDMTGAV